LIRELESVLAFVKKEDKDNHPPGYILSDSFFAPESVSLNNNGHESVTYDKNVLKDGDNLNERNGVVSKPNTKLNSAPKLKQSDRKDIILNILKKDSNLTIKDFSSVIKDCSEKTIQRELTSLVEKGLVLKVGERRWSTYSLAI